MSKIENIKEKVQKLLNQAADRQGTPEGDVFQAKAFQLMAQYGFEERDLDGDDNDYVLVQEYVSTGSYVREQMLLLGHIADALHCTGYMSYSPEAQMRRSKTADVFHLFGLNTHIERVDMLFSMLNPQMISLALDTDVVASTVRARKSFMEGFIYGIRKRLKEAEKNVAGEDSGEYALVLVEDADLAKSGMDEYLAEQGTTLSKKKNRVGARDYGAWNAGSDAAKNMDIGQTRVPGQKALA